MGCLLAQKAARDWPSHTDLQWSPRVLTINNFGTIPNSIIVPELVLPGQTRGAVWLLLDPVRERIFAIGAHPNMIHVLRDVPYGVEETPDARFRPPDPGPTIIRGVLMLPDLGTPGAGLGTRSELSDNSVMSRAVLLDATGRKVMELQPGENDVRHLAPGGYFIRTALWERSQDRDCVRKVVIQR